MDKEEKQRTQQQNSSLHLFYTQLAEALNDAGLDMRKTLKPSIDIPWDSRTIKEYLWRPIQKAQIGKESTASLSTQDINKIYNTLNRHLGETFGIYVPFPSIDTLLDQQREENK